MCGEGRMGKRCHLLLQTGGSLWVVSSEAACLTSCTLGSELLMQVRLPVLHPLLQLTHSSAHLCFPSSSGRQKLRLHPSFSGGLDSEEKLPAFLCILALHQALSSLCTSALSLLLFLPTRITEFCASLGSLAQT